MPGTALPIGFSGSMRVRLPVFALVAIGTVLVALVPFPHDARREVGVAGVIFFVLVAAAFLLPWERLPDWAWLVIPIGYIAVIAIIRDAQGGSHSGLIVMYLLPIVWLALYGRRFHLLVGLFCMDLALLVPLLMVGPPKYPTLEWREVAVMATVTTLVASTVYTMVSRDRAVLGDLAQQSRMARRNAREADYARDRLETLLRAATGSAIMGVDPAGTVTFFSAGAEQLLGYRAAEVVGIHSIADFIDPAQIDERRQTIDSMRTALAPVDAEAAAEVPWTATRKDGQQRRCVVRVRALPAPMPDPAFDEDGSDEAPRTDLEVAAADAADEFGEVLSPSTGGYVVVAIDVTEREELAADRERLFAIQKEVTQSLIEQNNRLRELTQMKDDVVATVSHELRTPDHVDPGLHRAPARRAVGAHREPGAHAQHHRPQRRAAPAGGRGPAGRPRCRARAQGGLRRAGPLPPGRRGGARHPDLGPGGRRRAVPSNPARKPRSSATPTACTSCWATSSPTPSSSRPAGGRVHVIVDNVDSYGRVQVLDEGPGIPETERDQLFERFYRLASSLEMGVPGTGLGLAIAKSVAEAHEGFVDIVDTPGWSTTFRVFIPLRTFGVAARTA